MSGAAIVYLRAIGFAPGEKLKVEGSSEVESHDKDVQADANGSYDTAFLPAVKGIASGTLHVTIRGKSCAPTASMDWGSASVHNE